MNFDDLKLEQVVLELRYDLGYRYWDKCGETIIEIGKAFPEWTWKELQRDGTLLVNQKNRDMFLLFSWEAVRLVQHEVENLNQFKIYCGEIPKIITKCLAVDNYRRIGNRFWYNYAVESTEEGQQILEKSKLLEIPEAKVKLFGDKIRARSFTLVFEKNDVDIRLFVDVFKRDEIPANMKIREEFHPKYMIKYDFDIYTETTHRADSFDCAEFVQRNKNLIASNLTKFF
jgi:hypothetical protein